MMRMTMDIGVRRFRGLETIELSAFAYNDRALALYRKLGFEECARIPRSVREGDAYFDEVFMRLDLSDARRCRSST